jgi:SAM-dependent methyltransferase
VTSYDRVPYTSLPYLEAHPDRLAVVARLLGLSPAPVERARVLELGCGAGGNLLPMADALPGARFVGVDDARTQIDEAAATARALGLANVELVAGDLAAAPAGAFDYVIAHGVYSWVAPAVQERLLDTVAARLAPGGVAFLSHNVKPGAAHRGLVRDMARWHARGVADEGERLARGRSLVAFLAGAARDARWRAALDDQRDAMTRVPDGLAFHEYLGDEGGACWLHELAARLAARDLAFLADADLTTWSRVDLGAAALAAIDRLAGDAIEREQYLDFLTNRGFRMSVLVRAGAPVDRAVGGERLRGLRLASPATRGDGPGIFHTPAGLEVHLDDLATVAALEAVIAAWPASIPFDEVPRAGEIAGELLQLVLGGVLELAPRAAAFTTSPAERPAAPPHARLQAARGDLVTSRRHELLRLDEPHLALLALCDGTRDRPALAAALDLSRDELDDRLARLAHGALLVA